MSFFKRFMRWWHTGLIAYGEHDWENISMGKRRCKSCGAEEWLFTKPYPGIGEAMHEWRDMSLDEKYLTRKKR